MIEHSRRDLLLTPEALIRNAFVRQNLKATIDEEEDTIRLEVAFRYSRVLMSPSQLRASVYLRQN